MPGPLFDPERIITPYRAPGDFRRAKVVESHVLALRVTVEELGARHLGGLKMLAQQDRAVFVVRHPQDVLGALAAGVCALSSKPGEDGRELWLDWDAPRGARLGPLHLVRLPIDGLRDVDDTMFEVDVVPGEGRELVRSRVRIDGNGVKGAERDVDGFAFHEANELARIKVLFRWLFAPLGRAYTGRGVIVAHAQVAPFRIHHVLAHPADEEPNVARRLPTEVVLLAHVEEDLAIQVFNDALNVLAAEGAHLQVADKREHMLSQNPPVMTDGPHTAPFPLLKPTHRVLGYGLVCVFVDRMASPLGHDRRERDRVLAPRSRIESNESTLPIRLRETHSHGNSLGVVGPLD